MAEYIEKTVAIARLTALEIGNPCATTTDAKRQIADTRPADVAPVVHGRWARAGSIWKRETMRSSALAAGISRKSTASLSVPTAARRWTEVKNNGKVFQNCRD